MRVMYETLADLDNERAAVEIIKQTWNCQAWKMPKRYHFDYLLLRDSVVALMEYKRRHKKYDTLFISAQKLLVMQQYSELFDVPAFLVVQWPQLDLQSYELKPEQIKQYRVTPGGRTDRNDSEDEEPVIHIPVTDFKPVRRGRS